MDMNPRYVKVTDDFDQKSFEGAIVVCESLQEGKYFSEKGWDEGDPDGCRVIEVRPTCKNPANDDDIDRIFGELGIDIYSGEPGDSFPDVICTRPEVRAAFEAAGFDAVYTDAIVVSNGQFGGLMLWKPDTFEIVPQPTDVRDFSAEVTPDDTVRVSVNTAEGARKLMNWSWQEKEFFDGLRQVFSEALEGHGNLSPVDPARSPLGNSIVIGEDVTYPEEGLAVAERFWKIEEPEIYHVEFDLLSQRSIEAKRISYGNVPGLN